MTDGEIARHLRERGVRCTAQRLAVLAALAESPHHLSAAEVHANVAARRPGIGLATVYRTLELLADLGLTTRIHLADGCHRYAATGLGHRHQVICTGCGRVVEIVQCALDPIVDDVARRTRFVIESHWLQFFGRCESCRQAQPA